MSNTNHIDDIQLLIRTSNRRIVKAVNECKTQATKINHKLGQIEKKKWLKKRSSSKCELEEKYDFDEDDISWGSDFDEDDLDEDDVANGEQFMDENRFKVLPIEEEDEDDCRTGHYDLSQLNDKLTNGDQLLNVGRFERISTPTNSLMMIDGEIASNRYTIHSSNSMNGTGNGLDNNLDVNIDGASSMCSSNVSTSISSSGVSSVCGITGSNDVSSPSVSSYASACCSSSCNSSAADSTCSSQSPPPLSTSSTNSSTSSSAKLACKLLAKLLTNSNGQIENNEHLSVKNLQLKMQLNEQLNKQFSKINEQQSSNHNMTPNLSPNPNNNSSPISQDDYSSINKSNSMGMINNNYLKNLEVYKPEFKSNLVNKSMINLNQYNQLNDYHFKVDENNLNDEIIAVKTNNNNYQNQKFKLNNSASNLSTFKTVNRTNKNSIVARQIEHLEQLNSSSTNHHHTLSNQDNQDEGLSSGSSSILSTFKYNNDSDKSYLTAKDSSGSCSSSVRSISLRQLSIKPTVPPKPNISNVLKEDKNRKKPSSKVIRPSIEPPLPPLMNPQNNNQNCTKEESNFARINEKQKHTKEPPSNIKDTKQIDKSPYSSSHSLNEICEISEFTLEEVNEILNCKLSDDEDNEFLNDTNYTRTLLQQQFSHQAKSLQHLNDLDKDEQVKRIENGLKLTTTETGTKQIVNKNQIELNEKLLKTRNDLIKNLNKIDESVTNNLDAKKTNKFESRFDHKFTNHIDSKLDAECLTENAIFNLRKTGNKTSSTSKLGTASNSKESSNKPAVTEKDLNDYEKPICTGNEINTKTTDCKKDLKDDECNYYLTNTELIENAISPPPEFDDKKKVNHQQNNQLDDQNKLDNELKNQLKRQHLQSRWSSADLTQQKQSNKQFDSNRLNNSLIVPLPPPASFNTSNKLTNHSSLIALPKLPTTAKNKIDFLNSNSKLISAKKLPNKLKSLPEIFTSKMSNQKQLTNKLIDEKLNNTFASTGLISQIKAQQQINSLTSISNRPLPPLPLDHYLWYHNLEREDATSLLIKFGKEGGYLVRTSKRAGNNSPYSLSIYHDGKCFNLNIRKRQDGLFALGKEKEKEKTFQSIPQLIEYHQTEAILLTTKGLNAGSTKLIATPNKFH